MGRRLAGTGGPACRAALTLLLLCLLAACGADKPAAPAFNDTDVMFLQMGLEQIGEGDRVAEIAEGRAVDPEIRAVVTELRGQWRTERDTMRGWLQQWQRPLEADPSAGLHAGHGELHSLREEDYTGLGAMAGADFDRATVALLLGNLHNAMETIRMEATGGAYPQAVDLAKRMTEARQGQIQRLLALAAG
ncbi:DUF305 domain-containing protein [Actinoplanes sp. CA-252034]|uniref:DUF305 domain-containing protein n=1 Tax=Actinoplanes sp. CA-252034 TaxID=3239906 RepID=UPI003D95C763